MSDGLISLSLRPSQLKVDFPVISRSINSRDSAMITHHFIEATLLIRYNLVLLIPVIKSY